MAVSLVAADPLHGATQGLLGEVIAELAPGTPIRDIDTADPAVADAHRLPGLSHDPHRRARQA